MEKTNAQKVAEVEKLLGMAMSILATIKSAPEPEPPKEPVIDVEKKLRALLYSDKWPTAMDPGRLCDPNSDDDKLVRAAAILDQIIDVSLDGKRFLDYGCGEGHVSFLASKEASLSVGYDVDNKGWAQYPDTPNLILTDDPSLCTSFDVILLYDVLDHLEDNPISILEHVRSLLSDDGRICVYCHPFSSRTGGHNYRSLNRAYAQLFSPTHNGQRVIRPLEEYKSWFTASGLTVRHERPLFGEVPKLMRLPQLVDKLRLLYASEDFPEEHLKVDGVIYSLSK